MDFQRHYSKRRLQKPLKLLPPCLGDNGGIWADLGCGNGIFSVILADLLAPPSRVIASDTATSQLQSLGEALKSYDPTSPIYPLEADFRDPLPCVKLDGMLFANSLHYLQREFRELNLPRTTEHLRSGGQLIVVEYNTRHAHPAIPYPLDEFEFQRLAEICGLTDIRIAARVPSSLGGEMYAGIAFRR